MKYSEQTKKAQVKAMRHLAKVEAEMPVTMAIPGRADSVANDGGGFSFAINSRKALERFLILGAQSTYYVGAKTSVKDALKSIEAEMKRDPLGAVKLATQISEEGRAVKNDGAIFVLAIALTGDNQAAKNYAKEMVPRVCRTATHMFMLVSYLDEMRGWGRAVRKAVSNWYETKTVKALEMQMVKYQGRVVSEGSNNKWTHKDVLRLAHPKASTEQHGLLYKHAIGKEIPLGSFKLMAAVERLQAGGMTPNGMAKLIADNNIPFEAWTPDALKAKETWVAALPGMGMTALMRNLARLTASNVLYDDEALRTVIARLSDVNEIQQGRLHPYSLLLASKVYEQGHGNKGNLTLEPIRKVIDALETAFYASFATIVPSGKRILISVDVSGSMGYGCVNQSGGKSGDPISCCMASGVMAMATARVESNWDIMGFANSYRKLEVTPRMDLKQVMGVMQDNNFGSTDCSLPFTWALKNKKNYDTFVVYTDSEANCGQHPANVLKRYRKEMNPEARLIVVGLDGRPFSIADPQDAGSLDVVGFDAAVPRFISEFAAGKL